MRMTNKPLKDNEYEDQTGAIVVFRTHRFSEEKLSKEIKSKFESIEFYTEHKANGGVNVKTNDGTMQFITIPNHTVEDWDSLIALVREEIVELETFGRYLSRDEKTLNEFGYVVRMDNTTEEDINEFGMVDPAVADPSIGKVPVNIDPITGNQVTTDRVPVYLIGQSKTTDLII